MGMGDKVCGWMSGIIIVNAIFTYIIIKCELPEWLLYIPFTFIGLVIVAFVGFLTIVMIVLG